MIEWKIWPLGSPFESLSFSKVNFVNTCERFLGFLIVGLLTPLGNNHQIKEDSKLEIMSVMINLRPK